MHALASDVGWLPFYSLQEQDGDPIGYFELSRARRDNKSFIILKEVRHAKISLVEKSYGPEHELTQEEEALDAFLTKMDCETEQQFHTELSSKQVEIGFAVACTHSEGFWNTSSRTFALTDGILHALLIDLPKGGVSLGYPNLHSWQPDSETTEPLPLLAKDLDLLLGPGDALLTWADEVLSKEMI
jgi:hypothetical protein